MSRALGSSDLLADFCRVRQIDGIRGISKSTVERASKFFSEEQLRALHRTLTEVVGDADLSRQVGLDKPIDTTICLIDGTCLEANIHWPTDWLLLKDVAGTLLKAIRLIREKAGLRHRMAIEPEQFARQMNRLSMQMTHSRRRKDSARQRKSILRQMKKLLKRIGEHARRHRELLQACREQSDYSEKQVQQILARIERMSELIPVVIKQAHERIIGGRQVKNTEKVLSVYEPDVQVIVRGKAGQEVEFGNTLFLGESVEGYLLDWKLYGSRTPSENEQMQESLQRQNRFAVEESIAAMCGGPRICFPAGPPAVSPGRHLRCALSTRSEAVEKTDGGTTLQTIAKTPGRHRRTDRSIDEIAGRPGGCAAKALPTARSA